ncbi:HK97 gp10 family phage protein [Streptomyces sp. NPDC057854]|uniref:HK97 gp10 family phage protein n=1 Tax=unclassified Streptomyces TaxID=2593676 RepID=UPI0036A8DDC1
MRVRGLPSVQQQLGRLPDAIEQACARALAESADAIVGDVRANVRKDTRALAEGAGSRLATNRLRADVGWWLPEHSYAKYPELGTRRRAAQPSLLPAAEAERRRFPDRVAAEINKAIR